MSMKSTGLSHISTEKSQVTVYFNDVSQDQLSQSFDFGRSEIGPWRWSRPVEVYTVLNGFFFLESFLFCKDHQRKQVNQRCEKFKLFDFHGCCTNHKI
ncbi:hypothetical protein Bca101_019901 [Brassica carinata]